MTTADYPLPVLDYPEGAFDPSSTEDIERCFGELEARPIEDEESLRSWLQDCMQLLARVMGEGSRRQVAHTRWTNDEKAKQRYEHFVQDIRPLFSSRWNKLERKLFDSPAVSSLSEYEVFLRDVKEDLELFREENTRLQAEDTKLGTRYNELTGGISIEHDGKTLTVQQAGLLLEEQDRGLRETIWHKIAGKRAEIRDELEGIFEELLGIRECMAKNADCGDFMEFRFRQFHRFDYRPEDCVTFHDAAERHFVPLCGRIMEDRRKKMGLQSLRPWDTIVDPDGAEPYAPYESEAELIELGIRLFSRVDPGFAADFRFLAENDCLDLWTRRNKAPGGYQASIPDTRRPFIFANSAGSPRDLRTVLHEGGHSFHTLLARHFDLVPYQHAPLEFAEVASMSMELMCAEHLESAFPKVEALRSKRQQIEHLALLFPWVATVDAFQHWLYTHQGHTREERRETWVALRTRFAPFIDWEGLEEHRAYDWHRQLHVFKFPFYYIEYAIAQIGALQVWARYRKDPSKAVDLYRKGLKLGGSRPLPELFEAVGARFDFGEGMLGELASEIEKELFPSV